jgi:hypothetical protein
LLALAGCLCEGLDNPLWYKHIPGTPLLVSSGVAGWAGESIAFCIRRLEQTSHASRQVAEMMITSLVIPTLAVFWRVIGADCFRVLSL